MTWRASPSSRRWSCVPSRHRPSSRAATGTRSHRSVRPGSSRARSATAACSWRQIVATTPPGPPAHPRQRSPARLLFAESVARARGAQCKPVPMPRRRCCHDHPASPSIAGPKAGRTRRPPSSGATPPSICRSSPGRLVCADSRTPGGRGARRRDDLFLVTTMRFDDRATARRGVALGHDARGRAEPPRDRAGPGDAPGARGRPGNGRRGLPRPWILSERTSRYPGDRDRRVQGSTD